VWMQVVFNRRARELRESEARFRTLFDNAIEGVFETWPEGGFRRVNPALARIFGYATPDDMLKLRPEETAGLYLSPQRRGEFFAQLGAGDQVLGFESEIRRLDGSV